jgi:hypothetical protein
MPKQPGCGTGRPARCFGHTRSREGDLLRAETSQVPERDLFQRREVMADEDRTSALAKLRIAECSQQRGLHVHDPRRARIGRWLQIGRERAPKSLRAQVMEEELKSASGSWRA